MKYILFPEGRILNNNGTYEYEYHLKDHLGSVRVAFVPTVNGKEVVQENAYYPFGATIADLSYYNPNLRTNRYKRESKEYITDFSWNKHDYGARTFDLWNDHSLQIDPLAEKFYHISPYALWAGNPIRNIDPTGMDWYSYQATYYINEDGEERTRTRYKYTTEYRSQEELNKAGIEGTYLGKTHFSAGTYYGLEGGTTSDFTAMISAITEDFGKMNSSDAKVHKSKAEAYFSQVKWNEDLPTSFAAFDNIYVVSNSMNSYVSLTDKSLKREFDKKYKEALHYPKGGGYYISPVGDTRPFVGLMGLYVSTIAPPGLSTPSMSEVMNSATNSHYRNLIKYYKRYNIIK